MQKDEGDLRERTKEFALRVLRLFSALPKSTEAQVPGKQLLRSGTSVGANYREAFRARGKSEFIAKCGDSLRELEESAYWLDLLVAARMIPPAKIGSLRAECEELLAIFVTIIKRETVTTSGTPFIVHHSSFSFSSGASFPSSFKSIFATIAQIRSDRENRARSSF